MSLEHMLRDEEEAQCLLLREEFEMQETIIEHTDEKPFCSDPKCPCHDIVDGDPRQNEAYHRLIVEPLQKGLITATEANHIFFNEQV